MQVLTRGLVALQTLRCPNGTQPWPPPGSHPGKGDACRQTAWGSVHPPKQVISRKLLELIDDDIFVHSFKYLLGTGTEKLEMNSSQCLPPRCFYFSRGIGDSMVSPRGPRAQPGGAGGRKGKESGQVWQRFSFPSSLLSYKAYTKTNPSFQVYSSVMGRICMYPGDHPSRRLPRAPFWSAPPHPWSQAANY